ncbi:MAG: DUF6119 family protein [Inquilinus sp.]|uniref:DUF6119 family protein n=1 Tax=Inquilinus sp. TaxID=1932117 RepID=UPI003F38A1FD
MSKKTFNIFLARQEIGDFESLLTETAISRLKAPGAQSIRREDYGDGACVYVYQNVETAPRWYPSLENLFGIEGVVNRSSCAILLFRKSNRIFASSFGHGWLFLDIDNFESDFGLRVAINALDDKKLKRLERSNLGDALRDVALSSFRRGFETFGVDDALDLIRKIGGSTKDGAPGDNITGSKSLNISGDFSLSDLPELAEEAITLANSTAYQSTPFRVIDVVTPVLNASEISELDDMATVSIIDRKGEFELGLPSEYLDEEVAFRFRGINLRGTYPNLTIKNYQDSLGEELGTLSVDRLRKDRVVAVFDSNDRPERSWSIRSALVGSIALRGGRYAINDGEWYRLDEQFKKSIDDNFDSLYEEWEISPVPLKTILDEQGRKGRYQTESSYNSETSDRLGYSLLDGALIKIPDIQRSDFEVCDLLDIEGKRLIHVKKSSRRSNVLSHFFKQGANSAQQLKSFPTAWENTIKVVESKDGSERAIKLRDAIKNSDRRWKVEFHIADTPREDGTFRIPFFSRITLRDEALRLKAMDYDVGLRFIPQEPPITGRNQQ